jgi:hypothetical protein
MTSEYQMNCLETRRLTLINPQDTHPARLAHLRECDTCARFARQLVAQDELIREATQVDLPEGFAARILLNQSLQSTSRRPTRWTWLGLAASFLLAIAFLPALVQDSFYSPFETELVAHVTAHDVFTNNAHDHVTEPAKIRQILASAGTEMPENAGNIVYASTCIIDGEIMAHLLVENDDQQYVVFLMPQSSVAERSFNRANWAGQITRVNNRSIAVLNQTGAGLRLATTAFSEQFAQSVSTERTI